MCHRCNLEDYLTLTVEEEAAHRALCYPYIMNIVDGPVVELQDRAKQFEE